LADLLIYRRSDLGRPGTPLHPDAPPAGGARFRRRRQASTAAAQTEGTPQLAWSSTPVV
jgi:hypothetical protein